MGRIGEPEDIANAVVFLVSPEHRLRLPAHTRQLIRGMARLPVQHPARLSKKLPKETALFHGLVRVEPVLEHSVALPPWSAAARSVEAADSPAPHGRGFTSASCHGCTRAFEVKRGREIPRDARAPQGSRHSGGAHAP
jgi:hypothetical protein